MDIQTIPFHGNYIVYRPLQRLAFVANDVLVRRIAQRLAGGIPPRAPVDDFLDEIGFWEPDSPAPATWVPEGCHRPTGAVLLLTSACKVPLNIYMDVCGSNVRLYGCKQTN